MKVIFDIAHLGISFSDKNKKKGIARYIERLLEELMKTDIQLSFDNSGTVFNYFSCLNYIAANERFKDIPLIVPEMDKKSLELCKIFYKTVYSEKYFKLIYSQPADILYKFLSRIFNSLTARPNKGIEPPDSGKLVIYHSPYDIIPQRIKNNRRIAKVMTVHDLIPIYFRDIFPLNSYEKFQTIMKSIEKDYWIITVSQHSKNDLCNYLPALDPKRVSVTYLAASDLFHPCRDKAMIEEAKKRYKIPQTPYILNFSSAGKTKNIDALINSFIKLCETEEILDLNLVLGGTFVDRAEYFNQKIRSNAGIRDRIIVINHIDDAYLAAIYSGAMMFVFPSLYEGFGLPPLEAMQCGVPVIASNTSSLPEVVGDAGILVDPLDEDALCSAIQKVYNSSQLRDEMSKASIAQASRFGWDKCAQQTMEVYRTAINE